jgi:hypothetical protein
MRRLGLIPRPHPAMPLLAARLAAPLPPPPPECNWHNAIVLDGAPLGNDAHANCVECAALRSVQIRRAVICTDPRRPTAAQALALYRAWAGWDGRPESDIGTASDAAAAAWATHGIAWGEQWEDVPTFARLAVDRLAALRTAIWLFGPLQLDLALPVTAQNQSVWRLGTGMDGLPGTWGAHRGCLGHYDAELFYAITWGSEQAIEPAFIEHYGLNAEATISRSWLDTHGHSPAGLDLDALEEDARVVAA